MQEEEVVVGEVKGEIGEGEDRTIIIPTNNTTINNDMRQKILDIIHKLL